MFIFYVCIIIFTVFQETHGFKDFSRVVKYFLLACFEKDKLFLLP